MNVAIAPFRQRQHRLQSPYRIAHIHAILLLLVEPALRTMLSTSDIVQ